MAGLCLPFALTCLADGMRESSKIHFVERAAVPPVLDGRLDDPVWKSARPITDFGPCGHTPRAAVVAKTEVRYLWDDKYLYVGTVCHEDTPENFRNFMTEQLNRDKVVYARDCIEVHIDGNNDGHTRFQSWLNGTGDKQIIWHYDFGWGLLTDGNYGLNADWDYKTFIDEKNLCWCCEARYALAHIEVKPRAGYMLGIETCRFRLGKHLVDAEGHPLPSAWQLSSWGTQGQSHHDVSKYGKLILVDKMPVSLDEGLALAYPDLAQRSLYVQTSDAFVVFENGRSTKVSYLDKAKETLAEVESLERRLTAFMTANPAPEKRKGFYGPVMERVRKIEKNYAQAKQSVVGVSAYEIGALNGLLKNAVEWRKTYDDAYWRAVFTWEREDGKVRQRVTLKPDSSVPDEDAGEADRWPKPETRRERSVVWAKPLAKGSVRTLICVDQRGAFDAWGLTNRLDLAADIFVQERESVGRQSDYYREGLPLEDVKRKMLENRLARGSYDAYVFLGCSPSSWPWELQCWLNERLLEGKRIVTVGPPATWGLAKNAFVKDEELLTGQAGPFQCLAKVQKDGKAEREETFHRMGTSMRISVGLGTYAYFELPRQIAYVCDLLTPAWPKTIDRRFEWEYQVAHTVRVIMAALGRRGDARLLSVSATTPVRAVKENDLAVTVAAGGVTRARLAWTLRDQAGNEVKTGSVGPFDLQPCESHVSVTVAGLETGECTLDAWLMDGEGVLDFASGRFKVVADAQKPCGCSPNCRQMLPTASLGDIACKKTLEPNDQIAVSAVVSNAVAGLSVVCEVSDRSGRILERERHVLAKGETRASFSFSQRRQRDSVGFVTLFVRDEGGLLLDRKMVDFYRHVGPLSDYQIYTEEETPVGGEHLAARQSLKHFYGIELNQQGTIESGYYGSMPVTFAHIPGRECNQGGSLSNPWYHRYLKSHYARIASELRVRNGRFVSVGDDSTPPTGFGEPGGQDWLPPLRDRIYAMAKQKCWKTKDFWSLRGYGRPPCGGDNFDRWSFDMPLRRGANSLLLITNCVDAAFFSEVKAAFREAYPTIDRMNVACGTKLAKWEDFKPETLKDIRICKNAEYVHFLFWLRDKYKTVAALNAAWGAQEADFFSIPVTRIDELKSAGKFTANIDMKTFLEDAFANVFKSIHEGVHGVDPSIGVGFGASDVGNSLPEVMRYLDTALPYAGSEQVEIARGQPHMLLGETIGIYGGRKVGRTERERTVWHGLLTGCNFSWYWHGGMAMHGDRTIQSGRCRYMYEFYREIQRGPAALLLRSKRQSDGIRILLSRDSGHLDSLSTPGTTHVQSRRAFSDVVTDLGFQFEYVTTKSVEEGALLRDGIKLLVLPCAQVLTDKEAERIKAFVGKGGFLLYDVMPGTFDPAGHQREKPILADAFGQWKQEGKAFELPYKVASYGFMRGRGELGSRREELLVLLSKAGLKPMATAVDGDGRAVTNVEYTRFVRGGMTCLGIEKSSCPYETFPMKTSIRLATVSDVYDVRAGRYLGRTDVVPMEFKGMDTYLLSLLPYRVKSLALDVNERPRSGETLSVKARLETSSADRKRIATHVLRVEMVPPQGFSVFELPPIRMQLVDAPNGEATVEIPLAWNEKVAYYDLVVTDVATGVTAKRRIVLH